ncbi:tripartite tricarboxylate transporter TctB family protein [Nocardiopsis sp. NPDC058789]|uniref:Tripartite tricarboxylate transporter TctB family protein n=1 Tax=Nocardiopsis eucommiae TaxID=2831970 RepID=A0A975QJV8_9ACTN|nr:tripartite tricarboxylate transporter TctB family protein [Nocardiopsis eucommiae]
MNPQRESAPPASSRAAHPARAWLRGRSEVFVGLLVIGVGAFLGAQTMAMHVPDTSTGPGPQLFPGLVSGLMLVLGALLIVQVAREPAVPPTDADPDAESAGIVGELVEGREARRTATHSDWRTVGLVLGAVVAFTLLLQPLGWLLSGALLFFGVSTAFGGRRSLFEAAVALVYSAVVQLAFVAGLGLNLPSGILGGVL